VKKAYLTIDDTPSRDFAAKMELLFQKGIPALFFCEGQFIEQHKPGLRAAIQNGFVLGNHAFSHPHFSDLTLEQCQQEIQRTDELLEQLYQQAGHQRPAKYFRFPYFDSGGDESGAAYEAKWQQPKSEWFRYAHDLKRRKLQQYLWDLGYRQPRFEGTNLKYLDDPNLLAGVDVRCTFDQAEYWLGNPDAPWGLSTEAAILARTEEDFPYEGRSLNRDDTVDIILLHDHANTTDLFDRIIERYIEKRLQFLPIPDPTL